MAEYEEDDDDYFDPLSTYRLPESIEEIDLCVAAASDELHRRTGRSIPPWRSTIPTTDQSFVDCGGMNIQLPSGLFYYPCSGSDSDDAIDFFKSCVREFHFSDPFNPKLRSFKRSESPSSRDIVLINHIGNVVLHPGASLRIKNIGDTDTSHKNTVISHQKDGLLTLLDDIPCISVFYYRGDSSGEGGSGQRWFLPVLLDLILSRTLSGGLLCCDGSNGAGFLFRKLQALPNGEVLSYRNLMLTRIPSELRGKNGVMMVWQVKEISP